MRNDRAGRSLLRKVWSVFRFSKSLRRTSAAACCVTALLLADGAFANARAKANSMRATPRRWRDSARQRPWVIDIADNEYIAAASGMTTGLVRVFTGGQGSGAGAAELSERRRPKTLFSHQVRKRLESRL